MKIPSEAELINMERRIQRAEEIAESVLYAMEHQKKRIDPDDVYDMMDRYALVEEDVTLLVSLVRELRDRIELRQETAA